MNSGKGLRDEGQPVERGASIGLSHRMRCLRAGDGSRALDGWAVRVQKLAGTTAGLERHDVRAMLEYLLLLLSLVRAAVRDRDALVTENLLLRHQLAVLTRPTRRRPR